MSFNRIVLRKLNQSDVEFNGIQVASSGNIAVYETPKGHWVCSAFDMYGNSVQHDIVENKNEKALHELLGDSDSAKKVYIQLGLNLNHRLDV